MTLFGTQKKEIDRSKVDKEQIRVSVEISLETQEKYSNKKIAYIKVDEDMVCDTHSFIKQIKNEIESIISSSYSKIEAKLETSELLSDGYKAEV